MYPTFLRYIEVRTPFTPGTPKGQKRENSVSSPLSCIMSLKRKLERSDPLYCTRHKDQKIPGPTNPPSLLGPLNAGRSKIS